MYLPSVLTSEWDWWFRRLYYNISLNHILLTFIHMFVIIYFIKFGEVYSRCTLMFYRFQKTENQKRLQKVTIMSWNVNVFVCESRKGNVHLDGICLSGKYVGIRCTLFVARNYLAIDETTARLFNYMYIYHCASCVTSVLLLGKIDNIGCMF